MANPQRWLTIQEYADERRLSVATVRRMIKAGKVPIHRYSRRCLRIIVVRSGQEQSGVRTS